MATVDVCTPMKGRVFNTKTAGGRMPLTPSPKASPRQQQKLQKDDSPSIHKSPLFVHALPKSTARKSVKSNIAALTNSPKRLETGVSEWTLTGTGNTPTKALRPTNKPRQKSTVRIPYAAADRFLPNRAASEGLANIVSKLDLNDSTSSSSSSSSSSRRPKSSSSARSQQTVEGSNILASGAADAFGMSRAAEDDENDEDDKSSYTKPRPDKIAYESTLADACGVNLNTRILAFKPAPPESNKPIDLRSQYNRPLKPASSLSAQLRRRILSSPERVLDAPNIVDDYYLNVLDWSCNNQVAIGLGQSVYVWSADTGGVASLLETSPDTYISSLKWSNDGAYVSVGLTTGEVQIWDVEDQTKVRSMMGHEARVSSMSWNKHLLTTGARNGWMFNHDVRIANHKIADLECHTGEICGLEWRSDGSQLAAGGNDNLVSIWDARSLNAPKFQKTNHTAAVKALAWCPWTHNLLATGGGSHDRHIHFWNTTTGARVNSIDTGSQVTSLRWSTQYKELASTSGFPDNSISIWSYPSLVRNIEIPAHESRVLHSAISPDGQTLATAAADESLKFWKVFEKKAGSVSLTGGLGGAREKESKLSGQTIR